MSMESESFWELYWQVRLHDIDDLGKREAVLAASRLVRHLDETGRPARMLELGCGAGQVLGALVNGHTGVAGVSTSVGVDYSPAMLTKARKANPGLNLVQGDFTNPQVLQQLGQFQIVLLVNSLHEVFSAAFSAQLGQVDVIAARAAVGRCLASLKSLLSPGSFLLIFDGLEPGGDPETPVILRFLQPAAREEFRVFVAEYQPFRIQATWLADGWQVQISQHDFARYITKSIFIRKALWETERLESYQYFTAEDFRNQLTDLGFSILALRTLTVNGDHWRSRVVIETPGVDFPDEHILMIAELPDKK
jgi:SAM-dependent methyltransferase